MKVTRNEINKLIKTLPSHYRDNYFDWTFYDLDETTSICFAGERVLICNDHNPVSPCKAVDITGFHDFKLDDTTVKMKVKQSCNTEHYHANDSINAALNKFYKAIAPFCGVGEMDYMTAVRNFVNNTTN